ncbi:hypothetical protein FG379_003535 [Cryptosporidium bovis]|uniref:uncharacterized protein n=1 Tax=Cryptosporidium bovis TaxID=310047 RepID=UPI00351A3F5D|nr:hypothetical protein FG379_003535 [Cryptosporidium bovis]
MFQLRSGPPTSRGVSGFGIPTNAPRNNPTAIPPQYSQRTVNPLICCGSPQVNSKPLNQTPPSRMISAAGLNVQSVNPPSRLITGANLTPASIVAAPERQVTEPLQHKQTFIYGGSETMEPEDCGWLEPIRLKVHAMEVQQYINPSNPDATPPFIYNVDHLMECVEIPENWAPESMTGVAALTFENLNTNPPIIQHPLRLDSDGSKNGTNNPYIQPIKYHIERIKDRDTENVPEVATKLEPVVSNEDEEPNTKASGFISSFFNRIRNGIGGTESQLQKVDEEIGETDDNKEVDPNENSSEEEQNNIKVENVL